MSDLTPDDNKTYVSEADKFIDSFPDYMHDVVAALLVGQVEADEANSAYALANNGDTLQEVQHPKYAVSSSSFPSGHEKYFIGEALLGLTLVLRTPGALWLDEKGQLTEETRAFLALVKSKHIDFLIHAKTSANELTDIVYNHFTTDGEATKNYPPVLREYAESRKAIYDAVLKNAKNGFAHYEKLGIKFDHLTEADRALSKQQQKKIETYQYEKNFKLAMAVEQALADRQVLEVYRKDPVIRAETPEAAIVVQDELTGTHYIWSDEKKSFVVVPVRTGDKQIDDLIETSFRAELPQGEMWCKLSQILVDGATEYERDLQERIPYDDKIASSSCSDSRSPPKVILGRSATRQRHTLRMAGAYGSDNKGNLTYPMRLFVALASLANRAITHAHHSTCGAMGAVDQYHDGRRDELPTAFKELGLDRKTLYDKVRKCGGQFEEKQNPQDVVAFYRKRYGIDVKTVADCLGLQQVMDDYAAAKNEFPDQNFIAVYQDMRHGRTYVYHPDKDTFVAIPSEKSLKSAARPSVQSMTALAARFNKPKRNLEK